MTCSPGLVKDVPFGAGEYLYSVTAENMDLVYNTGWHKVALIGTLLITVLDNGMSLLNMESFWQFIVKGLVLTAVVWYDISTNKKRD